MRGRDGVPVVDGLVPGGGPGFHIVSPTGTVTAPVSVIPTAFGVPAWWTELDYALPEMTRTNTAVEGVGQPSVGPVKVMDQVPEKEAPPPSELGTPVGELDDHSESHSLEPGPGACTVRGGPAGSVPKFLTVKSITEVSPTPKGPRSRVTMLAGDPPAVGGTAGTSLEIEMYEGVPAPRAM